MLEPDQVSPKPLLMAEQTTSQSFGSLYGPALDLSSLVTTFLTKQNVSSIHVVLHILF